MQVDSRVGHIAGLAFLPEKPTQDSEVDALIRKLATCDERALTVAKGTIQLLIDTMPKEF